MIDKPFSFEAAVDAARQNAVDTAAFDRFAASGRPLDWTPSLRTLGGGASPTIPAGSAIGKYVRLNGMGAAYFSIGFSSGATFGAAGSWEVLLPFGVCSLYSSVSGKGLNVCGGWQSSDASAGTYCFGPMVVDNTSNFSATPYYQSAYPVGTLALLTTTTPWTWATNDVITGFVVGPVIDGFNPL